MNLPRLTYITIAVGAAAWCAALVLAPALVSLSGSLLPLGQLLYRFFQSICHQFDDRSFHLFGGPIAVCSRCTSIYLAFLAGTLFYPSLRSIQRPVMPPRALLITALIPMLIDVVFGALGIHEITNATRTVTGALFGVAVPFFVIPSAIEAVNQIFVTPSPSISIHPQKGYTDA